MMLLDGILLIKEYKAKIKHHLILYFGIQNKKEAEKIVENDFFCLFFLPISS